MTLRSFLPALVLLLCQCATPPQAPVQTIVDDDRRLVTRSEFAQSHWTAVPGAVKWSAAAWGVALTLADGRSASLTFPAPGVVRWWVAAGAGEAPLSPGAQYPETGVPVKVAEAGGVLSLDTPALAVRLKLADLSWTLVRGDTAVLHTAGGPRAAGRRLMQAFAGTDATWYGPGLETERSAKFWISSSDTESTGRWAVPVLYGAGGTVPFAIALDSSYQSYTRIAAEASLGTLNGGLDLLVAASPEPEGVIEALTGLTGRPPALAEWATATALVAGTPPDFVRRAKLSIGTLRGSSSAAAGFTVVADGPPQTPLPDLSNDAERQGWSTWARAGAAVSAFAGSQNWAARWTDGQRNSPWARMNNLVPMWEARAVREAQTADQNLVLTASAGPGTVRWAVPELAVSSGVSLATALDLGLAGQGALAVRLDLSPLAAPETREAAFRSLLAWMMAPVLTLDWGPDPAALWSGLSDADKKRLKGILDVRSGFQPLFAQVARHAAATGAPAWRPVWFAAPRDPAALVTDEFLVGDLLVAPLPAGAATRKVYLPGPGVWFDFWTGEEFGGGQTYDVGSSAQTPPLFAKGGAFVPVREPENYDARTPYNPLTMHVFPGGRGEGTYYFGESGKPGTHVETRLVFDYAQREMTIEHQAVVTAALRVDPYMLYRLHNVYKPRQVTIDGKTVPLFGPSWGVTDSDRSAAWYEDDRSLLIKTFRPERNQTITMSF